MMMSAALIAACQGTPTAPPPSPPPPNQAPAIDARVAPPVDAASAIPQAPIDASVTVETTAHPLRWGFATLDSQGVTVELFTDPIDCATRARFGDQTVPGVEVRTIIPPGPEAKFYAGHATSTDIVVMAHDQVASIPGREGLGHMPFVAQLTDASSVVTLETVPRKAGGRVRGTLDGAEASLLGAAAVHGAFDVELCDETAMITPLHATAPNGPARGHRGKAALAPRTYQAIVWTSAATHEEAIDMAVDKAKRGSLVDIWMIVAYARDHVACPPPGSWWSLDAPPVAYFQRIGGTARAHPTTGVPQPTSFIVTKPGGRDIDAVWSAWIQLDAVSYTAGDVLHASVWSESERNADTPGTFGGRIDATVCTP